MAIGFGSGIGGRRDVPSDGKGVKGVAGVVLADPSLGEEKYDFSVLGVPTFGEDINPVSVSLIKLLMSLIQLDLAGVGRGIR